VIRSCDQPMASSVMAFAYVGVAGMGGDAHGSVLADVALSQLHPGGVMEVPSGSLAV
jgi:hypothetical protein